MRTIATCMILALLMLTSCKKDPEKTTTDTTMALGNFTISTNNLTPGQTVDMTYKGTSDDIEGIYYFMVNTKAYPMDINLSKDNTASITIPDSAQAVAFNLKINGKYDNNDKKGHLFPLKNAEGGPIAGSKSAVANYIMNYGSDFGIDSDKSTLLAEIKQDITTNPKIKAVWNPTFLSLIYAQNKDHGKKVITEYIESEKAKSDLKEEDYTSIIQLYNTIGNKELAEATTREAIDRFPKGKTFKNSFRKLFYEAETLTEKEALLEKYRVTFDEIGSNGNYMARSLAMAFLDAGDIDKYKSYLKLIDDNASKASLLNNIAWTRAEKGEELDFAAQASKQSLDLMESAKKNPTNKPDYLTENQYKESLEYTYNMYADTYAFIAFKQGNIKDAIAYQKQAIGDGKDGQLNERYIEFLMADEQYEKALKNSETFIQNGHATRDIKTFYKQAYTKMNTNTADFEKRLATLENVAYDKLKAEIDSDMINEEAPSFTLKNTEGEDISLASLKGKTVILDFWATWCGPCKASFPGMQEVATKYKDDDNIVLLFVDTFESGDNREKLVTDFIAKNNYDFHVVYDNKIGDSRDFEVANKYGVTGIPTKVIIDKNGKMRFKSVGYGGQTEKLVKEMDIMIDLLKS